MIATDIWLNSSVIARLNRAIQHSRDGDRSLIGRSVLDCPLFAGNDS
jgi:hypothetical protein